MKYLFYLAKSYSIPIVAPLVSYLQQTDREFAFYISDRVKALFPSEWKQKKILISISEAKSYHPDFVLSPGNFVDYRIPGIKVQLFHGLGVEKPVHYRIRHFYDVYLTSGPYVTARYQALQKKYKYFDIIETGWLKVDWILNYPTTDLKSKYEIPADKTVILYAPTFSKSMESASELLPYLPKYISDNEFWLLKFHELMPQELIRPYEQLNLPNIRILKKEDITPYLHLADLLVSDTSSVVYEFMVLDKPVITYKAIANAEKAFNITSPEQLRPAINECLSYPLWLKQRRDKIMAEVNPYLDGKTSERIVNALEALDPKLYPKPHKPKNYFRKAQVIYHSIFRKGYLR
ncbi:MAG: CDP-glycerol glycerophosphotransferase family protein [Candidatus Cloacimonadaceae bacterium]